MTKDTLLECLVMNEDPRHGGDNGSHNVVPHLNKWVVASSSRTHMNNARTTSIPRKSLKFNYMPNPGSLIPAFFGRRAEFVSNSRQCVRVAQPCQKTIC
jgi:hypothetical protein